TAVTGLGAGQSAVLRWTVSNGSCADSADEVTLTNHARPSADAGADGEICQGSEYNMAMSTNGPMVQNINSLLWSTTGDGTFNDSAILLPIYMPGPGDIANGSVILRLIANGNGACPLVQDTMELTINSLAASLTINHETCWQSGDASLDVTMGNGTGPYTVNLNTFQTEVFSDGTFSFYELNPGSYSLRVVDGNGCESISEFDILPGGPNLDAAVEPIYSCESGNLTNSILVELVNPSLSEDVVYALDSTNPMDFRSTPDFENISNGDHFLAILHANGCLNTIPFRIEDIPMLELDLTSPGPNEIMANVSGGSPPYTYFFVEDIGTSNNRFVVDGSGVYTVRVLDGNGCERVETITMNFVEIEIPNFFTPNNDGKNDFWRPKNIEVYPNIETFVFDRYGRKIWTMGPVDNGWDGQYRSKPLPSGDYWYIIQLNDATGSEFVGNFTLYR
ncbi:T9SS type B sorting domain-containing protein, partial [Flagellimonas algicola]